MCYTGLGEGSAGNNDQFLNGPFGLFYRLSSSPYMQAWSDTGYLRWVIVQTPWHLSSTRQRLL